MPTNIAWAVLQWCLKDALLPSSLEPKKEQTCPLLPARPPPRDCPGEGAEKLLSLGTQISNVEALPQILLVWIKPQNIKSKHLPPVNFLSYS